MSEAAPAVRPSSDELLAEVRRALLETGQMADVEAERRAARALCAAVRALDDRMSAHGEQPAAWGGDCWTVLGVWRGSDPVPIGVIRGSHPVEGGDWSEFPAGLWATSVGGNTIEEAEAFAIEEMRYWDQ
jgi:hypothetical protein